MDRRRRDRDTLHGMYRFLLGTCVLLLAGLYGILAITPREQPADLTVANSDECRTLDPHLVTWTHETRLCQSLYEGLTRLDPNTLEPLPGAAERWSVSDDGLVYTFEIRPGARWSNGDPVTAHDFVSSWERALNPRVGSDYSHLAFVIRGARARYESVAAHDRDASIPILPFEMVGVRAEGDHRLVVTLERPCSYFLDLLDFVPFWPVHRATYERVGAYTWPASFAAPAAGRDHSARRHFATRPENFVGNGALTLDSWQFKRRMRLARNPRYWGAARVQIETVDVLPVADANTRVLGYETGAWDLTTDPPPQVARRLTTQMAAGERADFRNQNLLATYFYRCNCDRFPTNDAHVRRALALAIDREAICTQVLGGGQVAARAFVPYTATPYLSKRYDDGTRVSYEPPAALQFDPAAARQQLMDAGWTYDTPGGPPTRDDRPFPVIAITYNTDSRHELIAQAIARMWAEHLGIRVELRNLELQAFYERERKGDFDVTRGSWFADYIDPGAMLAIFTSGSGHNRTGWKSPAYDALIATAETEMDAAKRYAQFRDAERLLVEFEMPVIPIFYYTGSMLISDRVAGITPNVRNIPFLHAARIRAEGER